ncbi:MAG: YbdK family carboxylate-amine ligase, partial [Gammaproteobacteria bacterium]|nr:YbdK family carboxylate-amine ligase [Gammaproteobacteria bacterium]
MKFVPQADPTLGCEWELQLLREDSLELADGILAFSDELSEYALIKPEFLQCCIEINTPPVETAADLEPALNSVLAHIDAHARPLGLRLAAAGTHPFDRKPAIVTPSERYLRLADERSGAPAIHPVTFATHVHVACRDGDSAIRAMRRIAPCLPALLAIGANSPYWHGIDTGYACFRQRLLASNPTYGLPPYFESWEHFCRMVEAGIRSRTIESFRDLHWDIRPHGDLGTLEIRVLDAQVDAQRIAQIASLVRALVVVAADQQLPDSAFPARLPHWMEIDNHFRACKSGLDAQAIVSGDGDTAPMMQIVEQLFDLARRQSENLGDNALLAALERSLISHNGAELQRETWRQQ